MKIGFIGAGKAGFSFGKFLTEHEREVVGFYSKSPETSKEAAEFTGTRQYTAIEELVSDSDTVFLTVPDSQIAVVWETLKTLPIRDKLICHFSGALSSRIFSGIEHTGAFGYSVHPLYAFNDKYNSYRDLAKAAFTVEGNPERIDEITGLLRELGLAVTVTHADNKSRYHAAAVTVSNLYVALVDMGEELLEECGFNREDAHTALSPLIENNTANIVRYGAVDALTGPIERNDVLTVRDHLASMNEEQSRIYKALSRRLVDVAQKKHPLDYGEMEELLK